MGIESTAQMLNGASIQHNTYLTIFMNTCAFSSEADGMSHNLPPTQLQFLLPQSSYKPCLPQAVVCILHL